MFYVVFLCCLIPVTDTKLKQLKYIVDQGIFAYDEAKLCIISTKITSILTFSPAFRISLWKKI